MFAYMTFQCTVQLCFLHFKDAKCTYPEVVGELQGENGDALVVKRASDGPRDVARDNGDEACSQQTCTLVPELPCQQERGDGGETAEHRRQKDTHIADVHRDVEQVEHIVDEACSHH